MQITTINQQNEPVSPEEQLTRKMLLAMEESETMFVVANANGYAVIAGNTKFDASDEEISLFEGVINLLQGNCRGSNNQGNAWMEMSSDNRDKYVLTEAGRQAIAEIKRTGK